MLRTSKHLRQTILLSSLVVLSTVGCAGPGLGNRLFQQETAVAASEAPSYVPGRMPLPSEVAAQSASVEMPAHGQYDAATVASIRRFPRNSYGGGAARAACSS